jgi:hypothetical protein
VPPFADMNSDSELSWETVKTLVDDILFEQTGAHLSDAQAIVLRGSYANHTYDQIAADCDYSAEYLNKDVGNKLWRTLSRALGEKVSKPNFKEALRREWQQRSRSSLMSTPSNLMPTDLKIPEGSLDLACPFYIERPPIESDCYRIVLQPGSLIRIRAPRRMGKTSLFNRILTYAADHGCQTVRINLHQAEQPKLTRLDTFLRWFCTNISHQLNLDAALDLYWDEEIGSMISCTLYLQHLLEQVEQTDRNVVIGLDEIDWVFHYPEVATDFLPLLRSWHEEANVHPIWKRLRLVLAHATEVYIALRVERSPFNVGLPVQLTEFNPSQVHRLAQLHTLDWMDAAAIATLMRMIGGHPYLVRLALYHFARYSLTLDSFLQAAPTPAGVYSHHLREQLSHLQQQPDLANALRQVVMADSPVQLDWLPLYQLESMGLVKLDGNQVKPSCELYRHYFRTQLAHPHD